MRMKWPWLVAIALIVAGALAGALLGVDGWRIDSPRISHQAGAANRALSAGECAELCREAFIPLPGVTAETTQEQLQPMLLKTFGEFSGKELFDAYRDHRMIATKGKLFFPTAELCRQEHLSGECAELCGDVKAR